MKKTWIRLAVLAALAVAALYLNSCMLNKVSINDRINDFVSSINGNRSDTNRQFDPASSGYLTNATYWNTVFTLSTGPFTNTAPNTSNPSSVAVTITGASGPAYNFVFSMVNIGAAGSDNWVIQHVQLPPGNQIL
jgi:hypothetical protein